MSPWESAPCRVARESVERATPQIRKISDFLGPFIVEGEDFFGLGVWSGH